MPWPNSNGRLRYFSRFRPPCHGRSYTHCKAARAPIAQPVLNPLFCASPPIFQLRESGVRGGRGNLDPPHLAPLSRRSVPALCLAPLPPLTLKMDETWAKVCSKTEGKRQGSEGAMLPPRPTRPCVASLLRPHQTVLIPRFYIALCYPSRPSCTNIFPIIDCP